MKQERGSNIRAAPSKLGEDVLAAFKSINEGEQQAREHLHERYCQRCGGLFTFVHNPHGSPLYCMSCVKK